MENNIYSTLTPSGNIPDQGGLTPRGKELASIIERFIKEESPISPSGKTARALRALAQMQLEGKPLQPNTPETAAIVNALLDIGTMSGTFAGPSAKTWMGMKGKFSGLWDKMERAEINDIGMKVNSELLDRLRRYSWVNSESLDRLHRYGRGGTHTSLGNLIEHQKLFEAYPELQTIPVGAIKKSLGSYRAASSSSRERIQIDPMLESLQFEDTILHEIQHAIQEREGFAKGGNPEQFYKEHLDKYFPDIKTKRAVVTTAYNIRDHLEAMGSDINAAEKLVKKWRSYYKVPLSVKTSEIVDLIKNNSKGQLRDKLFKMDDYALKHQLYERLAGEIEAREVGARQRFRRNFPNHRLDFQEFPEFDLADIILQGVERNNP